jgi:saccharopine dehydrogenase (NAD+, L-lysine-forming)
MSTTIHLRSECKALDRRSALTPTTAKALLDAGYKVNVERSPERIFDDSEFEAVGATLRSCLRVRGLTRPTTIS